ncbi:MAG: hypothetical protein ACRDE2_11000, partial [Chitinophagaceae bacterium]
HLIALKNPPPLVVVLDATFNIKIANALFQGNGVISSFLLLKLLEKRYFCLSLKTSENSPLILVLA